MLKKQRKFSATFKAKVAQELIKGQETINQICSKYEIHATQANSWKKQAIQGMTQAFNNKSARETKDKDNLIEELYKQVGQQKFELDWLKKKMGITN